MACFSSEQSHPIQQVSSNHCNPLLAFEHRNLTPLLLQSILIKYIKYRRTYGDTTKFKARIVEIQHKRFCKSGSCKCDIIRAMFNHVENCLDLDCTVCKPLRSSFLTNGNFFVDLKGSSGSEISSCATSDKTEYYPHRSKRVKIVSPETQFIQPLPVAQPVDINNDTPPTKYTYIAKKLSPPIYSEKKTMPLCSSETEIDSAEEKKVSGKSGRANQTKKSNLKIGGVSILEFFTANDLKEHLWSLRTSTADQDTEENKTISPCDENTCNLCGNENLKFAPKPIYCIICIARIKEGVVYYSIFDEKGSKSCLCATCFNRGGHITLDGKPISKYKFQKEKNDLGDEEPWVQCDKCGGWQHQICALYNDKNDLNGKTEYICPKCYLVRIESDEYVPIQNIPTFGAEKLPITKLSNYIEKRLINRLNQDRKDRAKASKKRFDEVPGATDLVVRVVLCANKLLKVNEQFLQIFRDVKYPSEFPFRSKVILLFQKIEGVDVCLFAMYVQEYGSECSRPNQRSIYISQIDSVKHFRPNVRSACGEALRTFAYHEILIGYLDYCKRQGFATAYIWSCPPYKGDDYVFYCHPKTQKTPKPDHLRQWYKSMLKKAAKEKIVVDFTNFYDHYFVPNKESNTKVSAARLPYFDGDYWSGAAIGMINKIGKGNQANFKNLKDVISRRTLRALGHKDLSEDATKDILLMQQLGEAILPMKDDFMMVHLQVTCTNCHEPILSQTKWLCKKCKNFLLCSKCHKNLANIHTSWSGETHPIYQAPVSEDVATDTEDSDAILETTLFEDINSLLSFCQRNDYQFDELRRAKHSSMMILYHIHGSIKKATQDCEKKVGNIHPLRNKKTGLRNKKTGLKSVSICLPNKMRIETVSQHLKGR